MLLQGLKPHVDLIGFIGMTKVMPCYKTLPSAQEASMSGLNGLGKRDSRRVLIGIVAVTLMGWNCWAKAEQKLKDEDCLQCHSDKTLTKDLNGKQISLFVDSAKLKHSIHGGMFACVDCHTDVKSLAHDVPPKKVTCAQCHADAQEAYSHSFHAKLV